MPRHDPRRSRARLIWAGLLAAAAATPAVQARAAAVLVSGDPFLLPEGIQAAPGGGYLVSEADNDDIVPVSASGAVDAAGIDHVGFRAFGTATLGSAYGASAGQVAVFGQTNAAASTFALVGTTGLGAPNPLSIGAPNQNFVTGVTAPASYGTGPNAIGAGQLVLSQENSGTAGPGGSIEVVNPDLGGARTFATTPFEAFGLAFAPSGFGGHAGQLFTTDLFSGLVYDIGADGVSHLFATLPLPTGFTQPGVRQIAFAPSGFGVPCVKTAGAAPTMCYGDLFVSVASQNGGGGSNGYIEALDPSGALDAGYTYKAGDSGSPLDPRGLLFLPGGDLLASNADPGLNVLTPGDFVPADQFLDVPEPAGWTAALAGALGLAFARRRPALGRPAALT